MCAGACRLRDLVQEVDSMPIQKPEVGQLPMVRQLLERNIVNCSDAGCL